MKRSDYRIFGRRTGNPVRAAQKDRSNGQKRKQTKRCGLEAGPDKQESARNERLWFFSVERIRIYDTKFYRSDFRRNRAANFWSGETTKCGRGIGSKVGRRLPLLCPTACYDCSPGERWRRQRRRLLSLGGHSKTATTSNGCKKLRSLNSNARAKKPAPLLARVWRYPKPTEVGLF